MKDAIRESRCQTRLAGRRPYPAAPLHRDYSRVVESRDTTGDGWLLITDVDRGRRRLQECWE